jgi:CBS domain-containing protein
VRLGVVGVDFQLNLSSETVEHSFPSEPLCVPPETTVRSALQKMRQQNEAAVLVCRDRTLVGIFTERDALKMMAKGANFDLPISDVMIRDPVSLPRRGSVAAAIAKMAQGGYRRLPIVNDQGHPQGLLKVENILHYLVEHFPSVIYNLPPEPHHATQSREGA